VTLAGGPVAPYVGLLPGGGPDRQAVVMSAGVLFGAGLENAATGTLAGAQPIGLVGRDRAWLAILQGPMPFGPLNPSGGRLDAPSPASNASVTLAPLDLALAPEADAGAFVPEIQWATVCWACRPAAWWQWFTLPLARGSTSRSPSHRRSALV
jgi:hypothetical protein